MGDAYTVRKRLDHLEEQFNDYQRTALFLIMEEFRLADSKHANKVLNKLKDDITADKVNVRAMRTDVTEERNYTNYIFFSNHNDTIPIDDGDRRFNIAPPQMIKLERKYPTIRKEIKNIEGELGSFTGFLMHYDANEDLTRTVRENEAKQRMKETAMGFGQRFCHAVKTGEIGYFMDLLNYNSTSATSRAIQMATAQKCVQAWVTNAAEDKTTIASVDALLTCYEVLNDRDMPKTQFTTFLRRNDLILRRQRVGGERTMALEINWVLQDDEDRSFAEEIVANKHNTQNHSGLHH
jgi:hypothetical protein